MAGTYMLGETKVRPGSYFNIQKKGDGPASGAKNGIVGVLFKSDCCLLYTSPSPRDCS